MKTHPIIKSTLLLLLSFTICSPVFSQQSFEKYLGSWNAELNSPGGPLRFGLTITEADTGANAHLHNGPERIKVPFVSLEDNGTLVLDIRHYDSTIKLTANQDDKTLTGKWKKRRGLKNWVEMQVRAEPASRTKVSKKREFGKFPGRWKVNFAKSSDPAVAIFKPDMKTGKIVGTFLTTTGDYRYLDGRVSGDKMELSCFDGAHAFLFHVKANADGELAGDFWSSNTWHEKWTATKDNSASLPDAFQQTTLTPNADLDKYSFPDLDGKPTRLTDPRFHADARIVYVFGSWCPNCHDAAEYFAELKKWYGDKLSIVGLAFEMTGNHERDARQVREYLKRHGSDYPVLLAGLSDKAEASKAIPFLDRVRSYPTTIFLDRDGNVKAIHTGFTGPATGDAYVKQKQKFESIIDDLIKAEDQ